MILVDTSIWLDHFRMPEPSLNGLLINGTALLHPFIIGEIALGNLPRRIELIRYLSGQPKITVAMHDDVLRLIEIAELGGSGVGYVDAHLVTAACMAPGTRIWTRDKRLNAVAARLKVAFTEHVH